MRMTRKRYTMIEKAINFYFAFCVNDNETQHLTEGKEVMHKNFGYRYLQPRKKPATKGKETK